MSDPVPGKVISIGIPGDLPITLTFVPEKDTTRTHPQCKRQDIINACARAGKSLGYGTYWWDFLVLRAHLDYLTTDRYSPYDGPPLEELNWSARELAAVKLALGL